MLGFAALLVDLGQLRATSRSEQLYVDLAALAAGKALTDGDPNAGLQRRDHVHEHQRPEDLARDRPSTFCAPITNSCNNSTAERAPSTTVGNVTVSIHHPVPAVGDPGPAWTGPGSTTACHSAGGFGSSSRHETRRFSRAILGVSSSTTTRSATMRPASLTGGPPALWVLDPTGCVPLKVDGGSQVTVGTSTVQGVITVDSDGTTCSGSSTTISATGSGSLLRAIGPPSGGTTGVISLVGVGGWRDELFDGPRVIPLTWPADASLRSPNTATSPRVPTSTGSTTARPATRRSTASRSTTVRTPPPMGGTSYPYIDNLKTAVGTSGEPSTGAWTTIGPGRRECSPSASVTYPVGNYYVRCTRGNNGFVVNGGVTVTFSGGNVVFEDNVTVSNGGILQFNTANTNPALPASCTPPAVQIPASALRAATRPSSTSAATTARRSRPAAPAPSSPITPSSTAAPAPSPSRGTPDLDRAR